MSNFFDQFDDRAAEPLPKEKAKPSDNFFDQFDGPDFSNVLGAADTVADADGDWAWGRLKRSAKREINSTRMLLGGMGDILGPAAASAAAKVAAAGSDATAGVYRAIGGTGLAGALGASDRYRRAALAAEDDFQTQIGAAALADADAQAVQSRYADGTAGYHVLGATQSVPAMAAAAGLSILGTPLAGAGFMGATTGLGQYADARGDGADRGTAALSGTIHGVAEGGADYLTLGLAKYGVKPMLGRAANVLGDAPLIRMAQNVAGAAPGRLALAAAAEVPSELATTGAQMGSDELLGLQDYSSDQWMKALRDTAIQSAGTGAALYGATAPLRSRQEGRGEVVAAPEVESLGSAPPPVLGSAPDAAIAPEPTGDLDSLLRNVLGGESPATVAPVLDVAALARAGVPLPATPESAPEPQAVPKLEPPPPPAQQPPVLDAQTLADAGVLGDSPGQSRELESLLHGLATPPPAQYASPLASASRLDDAPESAPVAPPSTVPSVAPDVKEQPKAAIKKPPDLLEYIAKSGGLSREEFARLGVDPKEFSRRVGIRYLFRKNGGMTLDRLREAMQQDGYLPRDPENAPPNIDDNDAYDLFDRAFRGGESIYSDAQAPDVARWQDQREQDASEYEAEIESNVAADLGFPSAEEMHAAIAEAESRDVGRDNDFDASALDDALSISELAVKAVQSGADEFDIARFSDESNAMYAARLWDHIQQKEASRAVDTRTEEGGIRGGLREGVRAQAAVREEGQRPAGKLLAAPESGQASQVAPGLFAAPTTRDLIGSATREKDSRRDGKSGTGRTDMLAGDGELFAGPRPEQARVDEATKASERDDKPRRDGPLEFYEENKTPQQRMRAAAAERSQLDGERAADELGLREAVDAVLQDANVPVRYLASIYGLDGLVHDGYTDGLRSQQEKRGGKGRTAGLYIPGHWALDGKPFVVLFTDVVRDPALARFTAAHEVAGHHALRSLLGDDLNPVLDLAWQNPTVRKVAESMMERRNLDTRKQRLAVEEALSDINAAIRTGDFDLLMRRHGVELSPTMRESAARAINNIIKKLRALFAQRGIEFTDAQVRQLLDAAWDAAQGRSTATMVGADGVQEQVVFHGTPHAVDKFSLQKIGTGEAISEPESALESVEDQTQTPEFKRWFGNSKVVAGDGKPLVLYHGTTAASRILSEGFKPGWTHLTDSKSVADSYREWDRGGNPDTLAVYVRAVNPAYYDAGGAKYSSIGNKIFRATWDAEKSGHDALIIKNIRDHFDSDSPVEPHTTVVAFRPEQIKSATANSGNFDPEKPSILESVNVQKATQRAQARRRDAASSLGVTPAPGWNATTGQYTGIRKHLRQIRLNLQDKMKSWQDVQADIESQGAVIAEAANVYRLENLMHGRVLTGIENIERQQVAPLLDAMKAARVKPADLESYLEARHAEERNKHIASINPSMPDGGSGMTTSDANKVLAAADKARLEPLAKMVDSIVASTRGRMLSHGLITKDQHDAMVQQYKHYVPLRGKEAKDGGFDPDLKNAGSLGGRGVDSRGKVLKAALGRGAGNRAQNILGEIIGDAQRSVILAEKARVGRAAMRIVLQHPNPALWTLEPVQVERALNSAGEVYERVMNDMSDPEVIAVRHKGELYRIKIENADLARALNLVGVDQMGSILRAAGSINRYFSAVLTKYNPAFIGANMARDAVFGLTGLAVEHGERVAAKAAAKYPMAARSAWRLSRGTLGNSKMDAYAREFADAGGRTGIVSMPSVEELSRQVSNVSLASSGAQAKRALAAVGDVIGSANDTIENALRLSAFATLREEGATMDEAAEYAKNLTVNFNRKGFYGSHVGTAILFFNASMQGVHRLSKLMSRPKTYAYLGALASAQAVAAMFAMGVEDDEGEPLWNKIPDHVKRRNIVIVTRDQGIITIPMPYGFNVFTYLGGQATGYFMNAARGDTTISGTAGDLAGRAILAAVESFSPIPIDRGVRTMVPTQLGGIFYDIAMNKNVFDSQIRRENPWDDKPLSVAGKPDTMEVFKVTAKGLNRLGGGDDFSKPKLGVLDRAPEDIEYLADQLAGGAGKFVVDVATLGSKAVDSGATIAPRDIPVTNRFVSNIDDGASQRSLYFERKDAIDESKRRIRAIYGKGTPEEVARAEKAMKAIPGMSGARFKRRKKASDSGPAGGVVTVNGSPQFVAIPGTAFEALKDAEKAYEARNEVVEAAYANAPAWGPIKGAVGRERDAKIRAADADLAVALKRLTATWNRESAEKLSQ